MQDFDGMRQRRVTVAHHAHAIRLCSFDVFVLFRGEGLKDEHATQLKAKTADWFFVCRAKESANAHRAVL
jgi:hypothetical protein